ncbi:hypothetical protein SELMODRAFT_116616 [Selaginella moellendorffii]|uniref:MPN domain-containing protein n=1 Tax=Selaginella moellendorffii TaxID=88036 RepID=D8SGW5_SELML|nr:hypothetical protein SELMODRAFT_116616 [Selaginella moellendorffii]
MALTGVKIGDEVWRSCLTHALSTETEEVMGLLLGDIKEDKSKGTVDALVWGAVPQARSDRRKDRVETTPEQLAAAMALAEISSRKLFSFSLVFFPSLWKHRLSRTIGNTTRVIGWYHSHPHITVLPSHVDLRTQQSFQMLDPGFIGVIFSCFDDDANMVGRVQSIAFQSTNGRQRKVSGSFQSSSAQHSSFGFGSNGERSSVDEASSSLSVLEHLLKGSQLFSFFFLQTVVDINYTRRISDSSSNEIEQRLSPGIEEAMHLSSLDTSSGDFSRKEIPMQVVPVSTFNLANPPPDPLLSLQQTVFNEEKAAFEKAMHQSKQGQRIHPLAASHHCVTHQAALLKLMELCLVPAMTTLWDNLQQNKAQVKNLSGSCSERAKY